MSGLGAISIGKLRDSARCVVLLTLAALTGSCDERELLNESTEVRIERQALPPDAISVIVLRSGFRVGETAAATANDALRALGTPTPNRVLVLRCAGAEYAAVSELLGVLKERDIVARFADAGPGQCGDESREVTKPSCVAPEGMPQSILLFFGEMHGSAEAPEMIGKVACARALQGPTVVALEVPKSEQALIDTFLESDGSAAARAAMLAGEFWVKSRDGRSSQAMVDLIEYVRTLKQQDAPIGVLAFDPLVNLKSDAAMAQSIRDFHSANPDTAVVALMGNIHASNKPMKRASGDIITTASLLQDLDSMSVFVAYATGTIWACMPECQVHEISSKWGQGRAPGFVDVPPLDGYDVAYMLPSITASPPAVDALR